MKLLNESSLFLCTTKRTFRGRQRTKKNRAEDDEDQEEIRRPPTKMVAATTTTNNRSARSRAKQKSSMILKKINHQEQEEGEEKNNVQQKSVHLLLLSLLSSSKQDKEEARSIMKFSNNNINHITRFCPLSQRSHVQYQAMRRKRRKSSTINMSSSSSLFLFSIVISIISVFLLFASGNHLVSAQQQQLNQTSAQTTTSNSNTNINNDNNSSSSNSDEPSVKTQPLALALSSGGKLMQSQLFEACKVQLRTGLQLTNLSQIMFQPTDVCSSWHKMMRSPAPTPNSAVAPNELASQPWLSMEELNLSHNNLTVLHDSSGMSRLINLLELRITHNQLVRCEESSLLGLKSLQLLDLSHNKLMALPAKFFQPVKNTIKKLNLSFNSISVLVPTLFDSLNSLEHLDLSHNDITSHWINDRLFKNLTQLRYLDLSFNKLTVFSSPMTFSSLQQLDTLSLQHNELRQVPDTIQYLRHLSSLDLSQNFIHDITNASYLSNCRNLFNLNLESNSLENITRDAFSDLPALKVLNLANNKIHHLDQQAFDYVLDLHALRLDSNRLIDFGQAFVNLRFLLMLNISSNRITSFDYAQIPLGLQWLDLHSNKIDKLNNFYYSPTAQQQFSANDINQQVGSSNSIGQQWQSMLRLTTLDASFNLIKELDNTSLPESLETVQLNNNHIKSIASHTFSTKSNLTRINLSHNQLSTMPFDSLRLQGTQQRDNNALQQSVILSSASATTGQQKFVDIYLANNPYICNCNMGWLSQLLLASSTLMAGNNLSGGYISQAANALREYQLILTRQLPRVADAHLINCHLPFARQSPFTMDPHQWSPVMAANQLALHQNHYQIQQAGSGGNNRVADSTLPLIQRQSELLASVHLCPYKSHCFALCYCCDFDACDCEMSCPENCSCYYDQTWSTNIVDCSANNQINGNSQARAGLLQQQQQLRPAPQPVKFLNIPDKIPMDVTELYLDGLELHQLRGNALIGRRNLKSLYLNNSQVYSIDAKAFATQKSLRILQLNSNYLSELHGYEFDQQVELRELYLANNRLRFIANMTFAPLRSLQVLHLQNNQLYHFNFWSNLPTGHKLVSFSLGSNPWSCQCDQVGPMLQWLHLNAKYLQDRKSVGCQYNRTNALHLMPPLLTPDDEATGGGDALSASIYGSSSENYPMFDMRMCLNYTIYPPIIPTDQTMSPSPQPQSSSFDNTNSNQIQRSESPRDNPPFRSASSMGIMGMQQPPPGMNFIDEQQQQQIFGLNNSSGSSGFIPSILQHQSEQPFMPTSSQKPYNNNNLDLGVGGGFQGAGGIPHEQSDSMISAHNYQFPPMSSKSNIFSSSFMLGATSMILILIVLVLSLIYYRRPMRMWFYSRYGLNMFSATKAHHNGHHAVGSLGKHSHLHHHHHPHLHGHIQCGGASSAGSTSSSSAASSNLSQALCQQQSNTTSAAASTGLVTTPLIVTNSHQLLNSSATTTTTTASPYNDDEKLFDAYLTYSKLDEQFISDFIAPELEYGQPSYRVALHYRDVPATAAKFLPDCIIETANASRRIIMVLSEQLLKNEWTQFEFRSAQLEALRANHRHRLIVIMLQPMPLASLDPELVQWLKSCALCLQWGDKLFWQRLRVAMPELPFNRQQPQYLRYQTLAPHQTGASVNLSGKKQHQFGANLLKSTAGLFGGGNGNEHTLGRLPPQQQQLVTSNSASNMLLAHQQQHSMARPLPQPAPMSLVRNHLAEEHHYAHLTPSTMIYGQQQHTYHQPIYGDPQQQQLAQVQQQQQQQQQQQHGASGGRDNPTHPVHI